jgi:hypothetical protein
LPKTFRTITCCLFLLAGPIVFAQNSRLGSWNILNIKLNLDKNWAVFGESQLRSQLFYKNFSYYEVKGGASYTINKRFSVLAGAGRFMTYSDGDNFKKPYINKEWRIWEQFVMNHYPGRVKLENRIRIEQRWTSNLGYRNRFKYRFNVTVPVTNKKIVPGTFYVNGWNEIYLSNSDPHFEQNKIYAGAGYEISKHLTMQSGYLRQVSYRPDETHSGKDYLQVSLLVEMNAHQEHQEKAHSSAD